MQWYTPYENENQVETIVRLNTDILTKVKFKSMNDVALPTIFSNNFRGNKIRLGSMYVFDEAHDKMTGKKFKE